MARPCKYCGIFFRDAQALSRHENKHCRQDGRLMMMTTEPRPETSRPAAGFQCDDSSKTYSTRSDLQRHRKAQHLKQTYACSKCFKPFKYVGNRSVHEKTCQGSNVDHTGGSRSISTSKPSQYTGNRRQYECDICNKCYTTASNLQRHKNAEHANQTFACSKCSKIFTYACHRTYHQKTCRGNNDKHCCNICNKRCSTAYGLRRHLQWHEKVAQTTEKRKSNSSASSSRSANTVGNETTPQYRCRRCTNVFDNRHDLYLHGMRHHFQVGGALQHRPWADNELPPWDEDNGLREVYEANEPLILEPHRTGPLHSVYNFPLTNDVTVDQLMGYADEIYRRQQHAFRLNLVFGVILRNRETGQYRYFVPYNNNGILERPLFVSKRTDLQRLHQQLQMKDITTELLRQRPDTKWIPVFETNVHFTVYETYYPLGQGGLPEYLLKKYSVYPLVKDQNTAKPFEDQLCAFRCLALQRGYDIKSIEGPAQTYYRQWISDSLEPFEGLAFEDLPAFEKHFGVNLEVYSLQEDGFARSVYKSRGLQESTMYANLFEHHLSYIRNFFSVYAQKYQCQTCYRHFNRASSLHRHQRIYDDKTKYVYPGGFHQTRESIFEQLDLFGINVPDDQRVFPWYVCYDLEAILQKVEERPTPYLEWTQKHIPISVSICSNVKGHTLPVCLVDRDQDQLVRNMVTAMAE